MLLAACDDGRIPEKSYVPTESGRVAKLEVSLQGADSWPSGYALSLAGFADKEYASIMKNISVDKNGKASLVMAGIPDEVKTIELCVVNTVRRRVVSFYTMEAPQTSDTIRINAGSLNVSMFGAIQSNVFNTQCANCHSGSAWAASLNLNDGKSYTDMVDVASHKVDGKNRVTPGDAANSILYEALSEDISSTWRHDHSRIMVTDPVRLQLIKDWINNGARE